MNLRPDRIAVGNHGADDLLRLVLRVAVANEDEHDGLGVAGDVIGHHVQEDGVGPSDLGGLETDDLFGGSRLDGIENAALVGLGAEGTGTRGCPFREDTVRLGPIRDGEVRSDREPLRRETDDAVEVCAGDLLRDGFHA